MGGIQRRLLKIVLAVVRYPRATLAICAAVLAVCVASALLHLKIDTDQDHLFSSHVPFFKTYLDYIAKFPENEALYAIIEPNDPAHPPPVLRWAAAAEAVAAQLRRQTDVVSSVEYRTPIAALGGDALLFASSADVQQDFKDAQSQLIPLAQIWGEPPPPLLAAILRSPMQRFLFEANLATPDAEKAAGLKLFADSWTHSIASKTPDVPDLQALEADTPEGLGYDYVVDQTNLSNHLLLVGAYLKDDDDSLAAGQYQVSTVRQAAEKAIAGFPEFHVSVTGRPALASDEMATSDQDSTHAEILALAVIFIGMVIVFRSIWLAAVAEISLAVAIGWTFGWATFAVGELNILSLVFLITLIGIGMDYLVQILTRYRREARLYERPAAVWARVFKHVSPPICTACLGAAGAFFVSILTDFRGASELGMIAGGGLLLCLASGYTVLPALLVVFPWHEGPVRVRRRYAQAKPRPFFLRILPPALYVIAFVSIVPFIDRTYFNPNLLDMQAQGLQSVKLIRKLQTWTSVCITPDLSMLRRVRDAVRPSPYVSNTDSIIEAQDNYDWLKAHQPELPQVNWTVPPAIQSDDLPALAATAISLADHMNTAGYADAALSLRTFAAGLNSPSAAEPLTQWQGLFISELKNLVAQFYPPPLDIHRLPDQLRNHYVSADGYYALYITPTENLWKREPLGRFVLDVENRMAQIPGSPMLTGIAPDIFHSTHAIETAFYKAAFYALVLVVILVFLDLRSLPQTIMTVSVLGLGLPMLVGLMGLLQVNWNFANFFSLPILIGAGHEYGVFMMHRYREVKHDPRRVWLSWDVSDRALLLCAFVTTSSFAFFWWLGHHQGLKSLGLVMALGIACIYLSAALVLRPLLKWRIERAGHSNGKSGATNLASPATASAAK